MAQERTSVPSLTSRILEILIERAIRYSKGDSNAEVTYAGLREELGVTNNQSLNYLLGQPLNRVAGHCLAYKVPILSVLVVRDDGEPGKGFDRWNVPVEEARRQVRKHDWISERPPQIP